MKSDVETRSNVATEEQRVCPRCGMSRDTWPSQKGYTDADDGKDYCCEGCATGTGCTCG